MPRWMILISQSLENIIAKLPQQSITVLSVQPAHVVTLLSLPFEHRDPFDRLLIAQALQENIILMSNEVLFLRYGVNRAW